jgi:hypothetical protein
MQRPEITIQTIMNAFSAIDETSIHGIRCIETAAILCHEANRGICIANGDMSQRPWSLATDHQRKSCIDGILFVLRTLAGGHIVEPGQSHVNWMTYKIANGWKVGPVKDEEKKEHPDLVPFEELKLTEQVKDFVYLAVARQALANYGPRFITMCERAEPFDLRLYWRAHEPAFDLSTFTFHGGTCMLAEVASHAIATCFNQPFIKLGSMANMTIYKQVGMCLQDDTVESAYDYQRATTWPHVSLSLSEEDLLTRMHWHTIFYITKAMQMLHGVQIVPRDQHSRMMVWRHAGGNK